MVLHTRGRVGSRRFFRKRSPLENVPEDSFAVYVLGADPGLYGSWGEVPLGLSVSDAYTLWCSFLV